MRPLPVAAPAAKKGTFYIPSLDGIRACAVMLVFAAHAVSLDPQQRNFIPGNFGVTVFFFLSGYLITTLLRIEHERTGTISLRDFYLRRVLRIFPPFYLVLAAATLLALLGVLAGPSLSSGALLSQVLYVSNYYIVQDGWWFGRAPGTWIFWSLAVEEHFYLVFPLLYLLLLRYLPSRHRQALVLAGICALVLAWRIVLVYALGASKERTYVATDTRIDSILFGCILGVVGNPVLDRGRVGDRTLKWLLLPLALAGLLVSFLVRSPGFDETVRYTLQGVCLFPLFVLAVRQPNWFFNRVLNVGWARFLGVLSYSIYLLHPAVLFGVNQWLHRSTAVKALVGLALTLVFAYVIHRLVEQPAARLRRRLSRIGASPPAAQPAPARAAVVTGTVKP